MKLTLKQQWRPRPFASFMGFMDIKTGVIIALLFAVLNKVAGVYGLIAVFTGGSFAQLSLYLYSVLALVALGWGLKAVSEEDPKRTLYFAHLFFADHILSTAWTVFFAVVWWLYTPHDGRRQANSAAQEELMKAGVGHGMTEEERTQAALMIWNKEKGTAAAVIMVGWITKIYFAILIYSYAIHLRKGSYRSLPHSAPSSQYTSLSTFNRDIPEDDAENDEVDDFYRLPARTPLTGSSVASFSDFISAPRPFSTSGPPSASKGKGKGRIAAIGEDEVEEEEVLFDSDELAGGGSGLGSSAHSKVGTEESTSVSSPDDETGGWRYPYNSRDHQMSTDPRS
ncbi:DUF1753-domain-containing protein [Rickenella mellea]|uniref:DUF1753-domain-containing protein n=1 Tax=Rickenella mellea TaxID=50990 RepID=A0A4Y7QB94_9AGAM|nr:DUF1753-domain-containing protein [Rickenella mellea]